jgi:hypothetical protein
MARFVTLVQMAQEGHAPSAFEMLRVVVDRGFALALDQRGRLCLEASAADRLRQEKREQQALEQFEAERAAAERLRERQDAEVAAALAQERQHALRDRERRLEAATGVPLWQLEAQLRREIALEPGVMRTVDEHDRVTRAELTLDDLERLVADRFGADVLAGL